MSNKTYTLPIFLWAICFLSPLSSQTPTANFATWKDNKKAAYSIIHDDYSNYVTGIYQYADPIATARGIKLCFGAITSACGTLEWTKAKTMISHGHECVNHSHNHKCGGSASQCSGLATYNSTNFSTELDLSTQLIETNTGVRPRFFIHPYDASSETIVNYLTNLGYLGSRSGSQLTLNANTFTDFMHLNYYVYDGSASALSSLNTAVNSAISSGGYAIREFHGIDDGSWAAMTVANYTSHLDYVKTKITDGSIWSATTTEAITYKMQRDAFSPVVAYNAAANILTVSFTALKTINSALLRTPVTLNVNVTGFTPSILSASQNGASVTYTRVGNILSFNIYPHLGNVVINVGTAPPAPVNVTNLVATPQTNAVLLGWTNPTTAFDEVMIVAKATTGFTTVPSGTTYTANANFTGAGTAFEGGKVVYRGTGTSMTVTGLTAGTTYFFRVFTRSGTAWSTGVQVSAVPTAVVPPTCSPDGKLIYKFWSNITLLNYDISDLTTDARYPNSPSAVDILTQFSTFSTVSFYGDRVLGYIVPQVTGNYTFATSGADDVQLFLSTDESAVNKRIICTIPDYTNIKTFTKYPSQKSAAISLTAGKFYYVELLHIQSEGEAHFDVYWQTPTNATLSPITSAFFSSKTCTPTTPLLLASAETPALNENIKEHHTYYELNTGSENNTLDNTPKPYKEEARSRYESSPAYSIFPNPTNDYFSIDFSATDGKAVEVSIISLLGKIIKTERFDTPSVVHRFEVSDLESGQYFVRIQLAGKMPVMKKLMIIR